MMKFVCKYWPVHSSVPAGSYHCICRQVDRNYIQRAVIFRRYDCSDQPYPNLSAKRTTPATCTIHRINKHKKKQLKLNTKKKQFISRFINTNGCISNHYDIFQAITGIWPISSSLNTIISCHSVQLVTINTMSLTHKMFHNNIFPEFDKTAYCYQSH